MKISYDGIRKVLFWPVLVPMALLVGLEYITFLARFIQMGIGAYLAFQILGFAVGAFAGIMIRFTPKSHWVDLFNLQLIKIMPTIQWGRVGCDWALSDIKQVEEAVEVPAHDREAN